jgi:hypothetical protein
MRPVVVDRGNAVCGLIFIAFGAWFGANALGMEIGAALRMGPGYFPLVLSVILVVLGGVIAYQATRFEGEPVGSFALRGMVFILAAPIFFGITVRGVGFIPAVFVTALIACFGSRKMTPLVAVLLAAGLTVFAELVFRRGLGLPYRDFGPWLGF